MVYVSRFFAPASSGISAGDLEVGKVVRLNEKGTPVDYLVVNQGIPEDSPLYDASCEGTWLLRKDIAENRVWDSGNSNALETSDIQAYLNGDWLSRYDAKVAEAIKQVKIPYRQGGGSGGTDQTCANGLSCKIFLLSVYEVGWAINTNQYFPVDGAALSYFQGTAETDAKRIAELDGSPTKWWLRSPYTSGSNGVWHVNSDGGYVSWFARNSCGVRPVLILPYDFQFTKKEVLA